jgi:uncharacterized protein (DUF1800 family)
MIRRSCFYPRWRAAAILCLWLAGGLTAHAQQAPPAPESAAKPAFFTSRTVLWQGRSQVIPFRLEAPARADQTFPATGDASMVEVLRAPTVLAEETIGYLRVRGLRTGRTRLSLPQGAAIDVDVRPDPAAAALAQVDPDWQPPQIVAPVPGATVWGRFAVAVQAFDCRPANEAEFARFYAPGGPPAHSFQMQLRLPDGRLLNPVAQTGPESGPGRQYAFDVPAASLPPGPVRLVAVAANRPAVSRESEPLTVNVIATPPAGEMWSGECESVQASTPQAIAPARPPRFDTKQPLLVNDAAASGGKTLACHSGPMAWCMPFVVEKPGDYQLIVQARGDYGGGAQASLGLSLNYAERAAVGTVRLASGKYHRMPVGLPVALDAGPQILNVQLRNDFSALKEDRNAYLDRYELVRVGDSAPPPAAKTGQPPDNKSAAMTMTGAPSMMADAPSMMNGASSMADAPKMAAPRIADAPASRLNPPVAFQPPTASAPRLNVLYPANNAGGFGVDALVARMVGDAPLAWADVLIDGQPQGVRLYNPPAGDALVFPLILRDLPAAPHHVAVRGANAAGQTADSPAQLLTVLAAPPAAPGPYLRALRLLDRFAFGPEPQELAAVLTMGETAWLTNRITAGIDSPAEQAVLRAARARYPGAEDQRQTAARALYQWMNSNNPVRSRFTAWAENHFSTWMNKIGALPQWSSHFDFVRLGIAPFADLTAASSRSWAMLAYLDQERSFAGKLNENYAREIMELHTLGVHGGYRQTDVTALAKILNGWTLASEATTPSASMEQLAFNRGDNDYGLEKNFRFVPALNDGKAQRVFGIQFPAADPAARYDRARLAVEMLVAHPSTARHICRKLAEHYVGSPAPDAMVADLSRVFMETGGDMRAVLLAIARHPAFWQNPPKLATPFDYGMRIARLCQAVAEPGPDKLPRAEQLEGFLKRSGMGMFDRVTPDGYPEDGASYADSNALLQRWRYAQDMAGLLGRLTPNNWRTPPAPDTNAIPPPPAIDPAQRFVDLAAVRLTGRLLSPDSNKAVLEVLGQPPLTPDQTRQALVFVSLLPEANLR